VTQDLGNLFEGRATTEHLRRGGVPELMCGPRTQVGTQARLSHTHLDRFHGEPAGGSHARQKELSRLRGRPSTLQVVYDRFADVFRERKPVLLRSLASHQDLALEPVQVAELESRYFSCPQAEARKQEQDRVIPSAEGGPAVTALQELLDLARDVGLAPNTAKRWISVLEAGGQVFLLEPYHRQRRKRLIKAPKLYFTDTGLLCFLLGFSASGLVLVFACVREVNDPADTGAALALPNAVAFLGVGLLQWGLGRLLDARWAGAMVGGARVYGGEAYREAFVACFVIAALAFAATCCIAETRCMVRRDASSARRTER